MMTQEDKARVDKNRETTNTKELNFLKAVYRSETGNSISTGCFCKSTNVSKFRTEFYNWYDNLPNPEDAND